MSDRGAVVVMSKAPRPGSVKTRLAPVLGHGGCAALQAVLLRQALASARAAAPDRTFLAVDPPDAVADLASELHQVHVFAQSGAHLGERMESAADHVLARGHRPVLLIGTDVPLLRPADLADAFNRLQTDCDVVFGPALDGGFYLVGVRDRACGAFGIDPAMWGGPEVLSASLSMARGSGLRTGLLRPLGDLDTAADARALLDDQDLPIEVRQALGIPAATAMR